MTDILVELVKNPAVTGLAGVIIGLLIPRFWMTRAESETLEQKKHENGLGLLKLHEERFVAYTDALRAAAKRKPPLFDDLFAVATTGDVYFSQMNVTAQAVLGGHVTGEQAKSFVELCRRCAEETIPSHFQTLEHLAEANKYEWKRPFRRSDMQALFDVVEKRGNMSPLPIVDASKA